MKIFWDLATLYHGSSQMMLESKGRLFEMEFKERLNKQSKHKVDSVFMALGSDVPPYHVKMEMCDCAISCDKFIHSWQTHSFSCELATFTLSEPLTRGGIHLCRWFKFWFVICYFWSYELSRFDSLSYWMKNRILISTDLKEVSEQQPWMSNIINNKSLHQRDWMI